MSNRTRFFKYHLWGTPFLFLLIILCLFVSIILCRFPNPTCSTEAISHSLYRHTISFFYPSLTVPEDSVGFLQAFFFPKTQFAMEHTNTRMASFVSLTTADAAPSAQTTEPAATTTAPTVSTSTPFPDPSAQSVASPLSGNGRLGITPGQCPSVGTHYTAGMLHDFDFLLNHFYILDSTTSITPDQLDADALLHTDLRMPQKAEPQILIYHTHSQEDFLDSVPGDADTTIVGIGTYLTQLLTEVYGYQVIHDTTTYDLVNGEIDRNAAYSRALHSVSKQLEEHPSIQVVIDLHRDALSGEKMTAQINGVTIAKFMFFNGLSRTVKNGDISYLKNPYIQENLAFSLQLQLKALEYFPDAVRPIYLKGYRYNLHLRPRCLLVEAGSQKNTYEEVANSMEVLAELLHLVLDGTES